MKKELCLIAHNIRSAQNVGALFRLSDGAGVGKIYLTGYTPTPYDSKKNHYETKVHRQIAKTALGAEKFVAWEYRKNIETVIDKLKKDNFSVYALENKSESQNIFSFPSKLTCALILGNEVAGVEKKVLKKCEAILEIPMRGRKESLNVAVAAGIAVYAILK